LDLYNFEYGEESELYKYIILDYNNERKKKNE
jgi:hypothetical protein